MQMPNSLTIPLTPFNSGGSSDFPEPLLEGDQPLDENEAEDFSNSPLLKSPARARDLELYNAWRKDPNKHTMTALVTHLSPLIHTEVNRAIGTLPTSALMAEGKIHAIGAIKSFDPSKGFALSTHVMSRLRKVRRMNAKYQNAARMPENLKYEVTPYRRARDLMQEELNREPTDDEVAHRMGISKGEVIRLKKYVFEDLIESAETRASESKKFSDDSILMKELISRLTPEEKIIFDNKGVISAPELAKKLGVNTNRLNYLQGKLVDKLKKAKLELGL